MTTELEYIEGKVEAVNGPSDKGSGGVKVNGTWWNFSKEEYQGVPWATPEKGETIRMGLTDWNGRKLVKTIALLASAEVNGAAPEPYSNTKSPDDFRSLHRLEALKLASQDETVMGAPIPPETGAVLSRASQYAEFIEGNL